MLRTRVAEFYRAKGYEVRENPRVRGASESIYAVEMVAMGPLGALLISFGDAGGVDAAEISRVRTLARDIGATPVIVAPEISAELRRMAAQFAVVVLDEATLNGPDGSLPTVPAAIGADLRRDLDQHPWPASGRARPDVAPDEMSPREVDDLLSQLGGARPGEKARGDGAGLWKRSTGPTAAGTGGASAAAPAAPQATAPGPDPAQGGASVASTAAPATAPAHPAAARAAAPATGAPGMRREPFSWLSPSKPATPAPGGPTLDDLLGPASEAPPAAPRVRAAPPALGPGDEPPLLTHEATLVTRKATIGERASDLREAVEGHVGDRAGLVKFTLWLAGGALALFVLIRLLT